MKTKMKALIAALTLAVMLPFMMVPASANSALTEWSGKDENNLMTTDSDSPIVVEQEILTFDIYDLVDTHSDPDYDPEKEYRSSVTAEYHFYNPSDMTVTASLAFPYGSTSPATPNKETNTGYRITVNGSPIEYEIRHTLDNGYGGFDLETDLARLVDGYATDDFLSRDLNVTKYTYYVKSYDETNKQRPAIAIDINPDNYPGTKFYFPGFTVRNREDGSYRLSKYFGSEIVFYAIGEAPKSIPPFKFYKNQSVKDGEEISGEAEFSMINSNVNMTFADLATLYYDEEFGISEIDWYNAHVELNKNRTFYTILSKHDHTSFYCWYTYKLEFAPGERLVNTVTARMIPGQNIKYSPAYFKYDYLISPASTWADFGDLDIYINTPYHLISSNIDGFEKTEKGYELHLDGLPMTKKRLSVSWDEIKIVEPKFSDLHFTLCESENPKSTGRGSMPVVFQVIIIIVLIILSPVILVVWIINLGVQFVKRHINKT